MVPYDNRCTTMKALAKVDTEELFSHGLRVFVPLLVLLVLSIGRSKIFVAGLTPFVISQIASTFSLDRRSSSNPTSSAMEIQSVPNGLSSKNINSNRKKSYWAA